MQIITDLARLLMRVKEYHMQGTLTLQEGEIGSQSMLVSC